MLSNILIQMHVLEEFYLKTVRYHLINKFQYSNSISVPKLKKITLNFKYNIVNMKELGAGLLALELIANQKGAFTKTKEIEIVLKIQKGAFTGCKVTLRKKNMYRMFDKLLIEVFPKISNENFLQKNDRQTKLNPILYPTTNISNFNKLKKHYNLLHFLPILRISVVTTSSELKQKSSFLSFMKYNSSTIK